MSPLSKDDRDLNTIRADALAKAIEYLLASNHYYDSEALALLCKEDWPTMARVWDRLREADRIALIKEAESMLGLPLILLRFLSEARRKNG